MPKTIQVISINKLVVFFLFLIISLNCHADIKFPITSKDASDYYTEDPDPTTFEFYIYPKLQLNTENFNEQEVSIPIKGEYFSFKTVNTKIRYLNITSFNKDNYCYKLIIYNRFGEGDAFYLNIQLNSYALDGSLIDALLLDSRYSFEGIKAFRDFSIMANGTINISYKNIQLYGVNKSGESYRIKKPIIEVLAKETYKIEGGKFKLISREGKFFKE